MKRLLGTAPIHPLDRGDLILHTDATDFGLGAALAQMQRVCDKGPSICEQEVVSC